MKPQTPTRPSALFVSPTWPSDTGNGLSMRAGVFLEALAADHDVHLLVVPAIPGAGPAASRAFVERRALRVAVLDEVAALDPLFALMTRVEDPEARRRLFLTYPRPMLARYTHPGSVADAGRRFEGAEFAVVHVMRTYLADFAMPWLKRSDESRRPLCVLDADECESRTRKSLAALLTLRGETGAAERELNEAQRYERMEGERLAGFDRVLVASREDADALRSRIGAASLGVVPNAVRIGRGSAPADQSRETRQGFTLLFVGTLDYLPNADGCQYFCREVLPRLREQLGRGFRVVIVGARPGAAVRGLGRLDGVTVIGDVPDVSPFYRSADVAIVPLRAGGGTRIKVLEAFAHQVPVVSTSIGAEGLDVADGTHALIADDAVAFANACVRLAQSPSLGKSLTRASRAWVQQHHDVGRVAEMARAAFDRG
jgi:glycosyltransferase involved in cell wall biosynthesis